MNHSESLAKLAPALVAFQAEVENVAKNASNPHFKSKYADLPALVDEIRPLATKHGLAIIQIPGPVAGTLESMILHTSGEWISGESGSPIAKQDPQGVGSAITYLRRYSLAAMCLIAQEDDDGNAASSNGTQRAPARAATPAKSEPPKDATAAQMAEIAMLSMEKDVPKADAVRLSKETQNTITYARAEAILVWLRALPVPETV